MSNPPSDKEEKEALFNEAVKEHQGGNLHAADALYTTLLEAEPHNPQALRLRGILSRQLGDIDLSLDLLRTAIEIAPTDDTLCELALTLMAGGALEAAEACLRDALDEGPSLSKALANLGALQQFRGHTSEAITLYQRALKQAPHDLHTICNLIKSLADAGKQESAFHSCEDALTQSNNHPALLATKGVLLCDSEKFSEAVNILRRVITIEPENDMGFVNLAFAYLHLGEEELAISALRQALRLNPHNARAAADLALLLVHKGNLKEARSLCTDFLAAHPGNRLVLAAYGFALQGDDTPREHASLFHYEEWVSVIDTPCPHGFDTHDAFHDALATCLMQDASLLASPASKATRGGQQTGELNFMDAPLALSAWEEMIRPALAEVSEKLAEHPHASFAGLAPPFTDYTLRAWGTLLDAGGRQLPHLHPLSWLSGVYYVQLPKAMGEADDKEGALEFGALPQPYREIHTKNHTNVFRVTPKPGRLVIFPSYFYHRTLPFDAPGKRISIAFDAAPPRALFPSLVMG